VRLECSADLLPAIAPTPSGAGRMGKIEWLCGGSRGAVAGHRGAIRCKPGVSPVSMRGAGGDVESSCGEQFERHPLPCSYWHPRVAKDWGALKYINFAPVHVRETSGIGGVSQRFIHSLCPTPPFSSSVNGRQGPPAHWHPSALTGSHRQGTKRACRSVPANAFGKKANSFTQGAGIWRTMEVTADGLSCGSAAFWIQRDLEMTGLFSEKLI
jgi:hypothetical protein